MGIDSQNGRGTRLALASDLARVGRTLPSASSGQALSVAVDFDLDLDLDLDLLCDPEKRSRREASDSL